jgi:hypothetical protein
MHRSHKQSFFGADELVLASWGVGVNYLLTVEVAEWSAGMDAKEASSFRQPHFLIPLGAIALYSEWYEGALPEYRAINSRASGGGGG